MSAGILPFMPLLVGVAAFVAYMAWSTLAARAAVAGADGSAAGAVAAGAGAARAPAASRYRRALDAAGIGEPRAQATFALIHAGSMLVGAVLGVLAAGAEPAPAAVAVLAALGAFLGWWIPRSWVQARITRRRVEMATDFPVALDLLQIALEGGMGLHAAWSAVADGLSGANDPLAEEMRRIELEVGFGARWGTALSSATDRTGLPEFRALGSLLEQTERFGTEMVQMVRIMSDTIRHDAVHALEERAHRASVLLLIPLSGLLLPGSLILMFVPTFALLIEGMSRATP
jgi:tight adherence protein C